MGLRVTSEKQKVYKQIKNNKNGQGFAVYSTTITSKNNSGEFKNAYVTLRFKNGVEIPNKSVIAIDDGFISFNPNATNGERYPYVMVREYRVLEQGEDDWNNSTFTNVPDGIDDELPFV